MNKAKKIILFIIILCIISCTSGCWDRRDFERFTMIKGIAVDKTENGRIKLSVQVITPGKENSNDSNKTVGSGCCLITATGFNLYDANRNLVKTAGKKPSYGHSEIIIFSEEIAREGLAPYLDYFIREPEIRGRSAIAVAHGKADKILKHPHIIEPISASGIKFMINGLSVSGSVIAIDLINFLKFFFTDTSDPVASSLEIIEGSSPENGKEKTKKMPYANGGALFREDKLVDWLTRREARGLNWILKPGDIRGPVLIQPPGEAKNKKIAIEIIEASSNLNAEINNGSFEINAYIETDGSIIEDTASEYSIISNKHLKQLDKRYAQVIRNEILNTLKKSQKYGSDIFAFGEAIYRQYPEEFMEIKNNWSNVYRNLKVNIEVKADIRRIGMLKEPVDTHEKL